MTDQSLPPIVWRKSTRVVLRPLRESDTPFISAWINDPEVTQFLQAHMPMAETEERDWIENLANRKPHDIVVAIEADGVFIGTMGLHGIDYKNRRATTGTLIGNKAYQGKGYGTEAKMLLLDYAFNELGLNKICSSVIAYNERSIRYSLKCGYREEGRLRKHLFRKGRYWDEVRLAVFRKDWLPHWKKFKKEHRL
jgi:RimJ/RimL family protein N-acetyltransferase